MANMPTARRYMTTSVVDGKIYAIGGIGGLDKTEVYDPDANTWSTRADMPTPRVFASAGVVDGRIYVIGGADRLHGTPYAAVEAYDPETDVWTRMSDMPGRAYFMNSGTLNGKIYLIGGYATGGRPGDTPLSSVYEFDPETDTWTERSGLPSGRALGYAGVIDGEIYGVGGLTAAWPASSTTWKYDPVADEWTTRASLPAPRAGAGADVLGDRIYAFGGIGGHGYLSERSVFTYDPASDTWDTLEDMPFRRSGMGAVAVGGSFYLIGGTAVSYPYDPSLDAVWRFTPVDPDDPDGDGITTEVELAHGLDPDVPDADSDYDGDGVIARDEIERGTMANNPDSDGDGLSDGVETNSGEFVNAMDTGTDPTTADTDGDGQSDGAEVAGGSNPLDASSLYGDWPDLIPLDTAGFEPEGIELGRGEDFFVGAFSYSSWFGQPFSPWSGAIFKGNLRTGEGRVFVEPTGIPIKGLSYDARTDYLWVAKGMGAGTQGVIVYDATSGEEIANVTLEGGRTNNDILVTGDYVYCTDSYSPVLYRIPLGEGGRLLEPLVVEDVPMNGFVMDPDPASVNANGVVKAADGSLIVVNITTGVLFRVNTATGVTAPIPITGAEQRYVDGDGLYLDGQLLYICQNFSNKIGVVQLSADFTSGTFMWNLVSGNLSVPTTITGYGDFIYAINTNFSQIAAGSHAESIPAVVKLPKVGTPPVRVTGIGLEEGGSAVRIAFDTPAPADLFDVILEQAADLSGPWSGSSSEVRESGDGRFFLQTSDPARGREFYRVRVRRR